MSGTKKEAGLEAQDLRSTTEGATTAASGATGEADRRIKPRHAVSINVTLFGEHNFYVGLSENLSEGGLFVGTQNILPIGTLIRMEFTLPTFPDAVSVVGEVRWVRSPNAFSKDHNNFSSGGGDAGRPGMGIQFKELTPEVSKAITKFIGIRDPEFYID